MDSKQYNRLSFDLQDEGYEPFVDEWDDRYAQEYGECCTCESRNIYLEGFKRGGSYRTFMVCRDCGEAFEL
ncbi:MAG: hypothetical protein SF123_09705 [Chloroflexota bacterium]|nr:hypothetical protein [Chloroflexota bacterium]